MKKKRPDDFEFELHMELQNHKPQKRLEDTLQFYRENLPLEAVGKLFNESKNTPAEQNDNASSYNDFINKYNMNDADGDARKKIPTPKKRIRSDAENDFLNEFDNRSELFPYDYSKPRSSLGKVIVAFIFVIFLCVIAALLFKIKSLNNQLADIKLQINENAQAAEQLQGLLIENENMKKMIEALSNDEATENSQVENVGQSENKIEAPASTDETEYIVQPGDTLSGISQKFYGSTVLYSKIVERNKLTSENLNENQKLIIPAM